jgi:hypothetical protein
MGRQVLETTSNLQTTILFICLKAIVLTNLRIIDLAVEDGRGVLGLDA